MKRFHLDIANSTFSYYKENLGKRGMSSGMSNHTLSECPPTALKTKTVTGNNNFTNHVSRIHSLLSY